MEDKITEDEKVHGLVKKAEYLCRTQGKVISEVPLKVYRYAPCIDDLELYLIEGESEKGSFSEITARDSKSPALLDYFISGSSEDSGRIDYFQKGSWESLIEDNYNQALFG